MQIFIGFLTKMPAMKAKEQKKLKEMQFLG